MARSSFRGRCPRESAGAGCKARAYASGLKPGADRVASGIAGIVSGGATPGFTRAFLVLVYSDLGERSATNTTYGKSVFRRSSSEAARSPRPWGGESTGTREAVWGQRSLCLEDFPAASANRPDGAGATAAWPTKPDDPRGPVEFARSAAAAARLHTARATAPSGRAGPSESQCAASLAGAAEDGMAAEKKSLHAQEQDTAAAQARRQAWWAAVSRIDPQQRSIES